MGMGFKEGGEGWTLGLGHCRNVEKWATIAQTQKKKKPPGRE